MLFDSIHVFYTDVVIILKDGAGYHRTRCARLTGTYRSRNNIEVTRVGGVHSVDAINIRSTIVGASAYHINSHPFYTGIIPVVLEGTTDAHAIVYSKRTGHRSRIAAVIGHRPGNYRVAAVCRRSCRIYTIVGFHQAAIHVSRNGVVYAYRNRGSATGVGYTGIPGSKLVINIRGCSASNCRCIICRLISNQQHRRFRNGYGSVRIATVSIRHNHRVRAGNQIGGRCVGLGIAPCISVWRSSAGRRYCCRTVLPSIAGYVGLGSTQGQTVRLRNGSSSGELTAVVVRNRYGVRARIETCNRNRTVAGWCSFPVVSIRHGAAHSCYCGRTIRKTATRHIDLCRNVGRQRRWFYDCNRCSSLTAIVICYRHRVGTGRETGCGSA